MEFQSRNIMILMIACIISQSAPSPVMAAEGDKAPFFTATTLEMEGLGSCPPRINGVHISMAERETNAIRLAESDALRRVAMLISKVLVSWNREGRIQLDQQILTDEFLSEVEERVLDHFERVGQPDIATFADGSVRAKVKIRCAVSPVVQSLMPQMGFKLSFNRALERDVITLIVNQLPPRAHLIIEPFKELSEQRFTAEQKLAAKIFRSMLMEKLRQNQFQVTLCNRDPSDWQVIERELEFMTRMVAQERAAPNTDLVQRILGGTTLVTSEIAFMKDNKSLFVVVRITDYKSAEFVVVNAFLPNPVSSMNQ